MSKCYDDSEYKRRRRRNDEEERPRRKRDREEEHDDADVVQDGVQKSFIDQESDELVWIKDSCNVEVQSTDTQAAVSLQVGLQLAIALVVSITIGDSDEGQSVAQELFQQFDTEQTNKQKIFVENSKDVTITTTDTDLSVNIQALLQVLVALVVKLDVL
ncbi:spore coat protein [Domibacillus robiginosus]|uniref:spore coat protein n=1 Tax=Domibacillus robiginosus TaxID=1071054 RepID=UPI0009E59A62|nr:spore coat protein [Domibacillus robiginosus]